MTDTQRKTDAHSQSNLEAATIVASNPQLYPPDSLLGQWAALMLGRAEMSTAADTPAAGPLFETEEA